jgi:aspartate aminotransferase
MATTVPLFEFFTNSRWAARASSPEISDFVIGNPHEPTVPGFVKALQTWSEPQNKDWFAYKFSEPASREAVAAGLRSRRGVAFDPSDIVMTNGAFAGLAVCLRTVVNPGEEVVYVTPPWFFYEAMIRGIGAEPVPVAALPENFDLDVDAIGAAITSRTRAVLVNSPHNPSGRVYPAETLDQLGKVLTEASRRHGRPIFLLSDEAYHRILFDGRSFPSPTEHYPYSFVIYTYGKTMLTPGQRIGWIALPPTMPLADRERLRPALEMAQITTGFAYPNALLQHAIGDLEVLSIDMSHLQQKRDRMVGALRGQGYDLLEPEGTFYILVRSPLADDQAFCDLLADRDVLVLPGAVAQVAGWFRISLTATAEMIERALPVFGEVLAESRQLTVAPNATGS